MSNGSKHLIELSTEAFPALLASLRALPFNHMFARSVIERLVDGRVWVDRADAPRLVHVVHPYGMTLLFGSADRADRDGLKAHLRDCRHDSHDLWMQASPGIPANALDELLDAEVASADRPPGGSRVQRYTRANFRYDPIRGAKQRTALAPLIGACLRPIRPDEFALPDISVSPHVFWRAYEQFLSRGGGWCIERDDTPVSMAFSSFRFDDQLEIGVETRTHFRGRGYARHAASAMVDQCLAEGLEPIWSCRKENVGSYRLALTLGFEPTLELPYYRLPAVAGGGGDAVTRPDAGRR